MISFYGNSLGFEHYILAYADADEVLLDNHWFAQKKERLF
jgi:hypothetical protein